MPSGNRTGPLGYGSRTGHGLGYCAGNENPRFIKSTPQDVGFGRGLELGRGFWRRGRGFWCRDFYMDPYYQHASYNQDINPEQNKIDEKTYLENMIKCLEEEIKNIHERLKEISESK